VGTLPFKEHRAGGGLPCDETLESKGVPKSGRRDSYSMARDVGRTRGDTDDREDGGSAVDMADTAHEEDVDPPGLVCKVIVLMCGIATFARTECILLQTVLFAECECCSPCMHVRARFPHIFHPLFSKVSWDCALPRIRLLCASGSELVSEARMSNHSHTRRAGHASAEIHTLVLHVWLHVLCVIP